MSSAGIGILALGLLAQPIPPELRDQAARKHRIDPFLPAAVAEVAKKAAEAELDPKRGPGNAMEVLQAGRRAHAGDRDLEIAFDLRVAATVLRSRFVHNEKVPEGIRYQQALSTFSKLDLTDPGLSRWLALTLEKNPKEAKGLERRGTTLGLSLLTRGEGLDRDRIQTRVAEILSPLGFGVARRQPKEAELTIKIGADRIASPEAGVVVRLTFDAEDKAEDGSTRFKKSLFRSASAASAEDAVTAAMEWLLRIGLREVFFARLALDLPNVVMTAPGAGEHGGHGAHRTVELPKTGGIEPSPEPRGSR